MQPPIGTTFARQALDERQRAHPLLVGDDRIAQLYRLIDPHMPEVLRDLVRQGHVALGEVGYHTPIVRTEQVFGDWVIEISSGLMQFVYAISRSLMGATRAAAQVRIAKAKNEAAARNELAKDLALDFREWNRDLFAGKKTMTSPARRLEPARVADAEALTTMAELFILLRELARVIAAISPVENDLKAESRELMLDSIGATLLFNTTVFEDQSVKSAYAGAVLAIRCVSGLERIGREVGVPAPPAETRISCVDHSLLELLKEDEGAFVIVSADGAHADALLECAELDLAGEPIEPRHTAERLAGLCFLALSRYADGAIDEKKMRSRAAVATREADEDVIAEARRYLKLALADEKMQRPGAILAMREACARLRKDLPAPGRTLFDLSENDEQ